MSSRSLGWRILLGRTLTRSGDQAWDFAVPLILLKILPGQIQIAALYYLIVRFLHVLLVPKLSSTLDRIDRLSAAKLGIGLQLVGVIFGSISIYWIWELQSQLRMWESLEYNLSFLIIIIGGLLSSLGSTFMDISVANDLVPSSITESELSQFNSRLRQVDLFTEVTSPIIAGALMLIETPSLPIMGFFIVAAWNVISFFPEYGLLHSIFKFRPDLKSKKIQISNTTKTPLIKKLTVGWRVFFKEPVALAVFAYALLWLSVLSPHGVLLTGFLKDGWKLSDLTIGVFRGLGAFFGLAATMLYPIIIKKYGLLRGSRFFINFQAASLVLALTLFNFDVNIGIYGFLIFILISRIGLYGFSMGEMQIRQVGIRAEVRGEMNGFANGLTGIATLGLYGAGALLPSTKDFSFLIILSVFFVLLASLLFSYWGSRVPKILINRPDLNP